MLIETESVILLTIKLYLLLQANKHNSLLYNFRAYGYVARKKEMKIENIKGF